MGKIFSKTMTFDDFKTMQKETPKGKLDTFIEICQKMEAIAVEYNSASDELIREVLKKKNFHWFMYEHLLTIGEDELTMSQKFDLMKTAEYWTISNVGSKKEIIISFINKGKTISTIPIPYDEFRDFIEEE